MRLLLGVEAVELGQDERRRLARTATATARSLARKCLRLAASICSVTMSRIRMEHTQKLRNLTWLIEIGPSIAISLHNL